MGKKRILFFDTETSGLPKNYKAPVTDLGNWPLIVQLAWIVADEDGAIISKRQMLVKPYRNGEPIDISAEAQAVHGHTFEKLEAEGIKIDHALMAILIDISDADLIVAHNLGYDAPILASEMIRAKIERIEGKPKFCTMQATTNVCKIPGPYGYKWPKLQELHKFLFGTEFDGAHDAMSDIEATYKCYFELKKRGLANVPV